MVYVAWIVVLILVANTLYLYLFSVAGWLMPRQAPKKAANERGLDTLVLYPAYKEDEVIIQSVKSFMAQRPAEHRYKLVVIADALKEETLITIQKFGAAVCRLPVSDKRNKARAINYLLEHTAGSYDNCIIMDADNTVEPDFIENMNRYFLGGAKVVQARRVAKNSSNSLSTLDTYSEIINNHIFRKGQRALGFSSSLIGSGMGFEFSLFKEVMQGMDVFSGFDKELELRLLERGIKMEYAEEVLVYDEKVAHHDVFVNQRRRWLYAQVYFLQKNFGKAISKALHGNFDYANKVLQFLLLPRVMCLGLAGIMLLVSAFLTPTMFVVTLIANVLLAIALVLPLRFKTSLSASASAAMALPRVFINMGFALFTSGRASKRFLHTPHHSK
ncbi:MAG TPA: glycosyltransferase family 2 protein [Chitinophagales bacterium]|nr:glycosyltransferase family 2 protein [Chitinophagales bacterium]